jgi:hypothetical protein
MVVLGSFFIICCVIPMCVFNLHLVCGYNSVVSELQYIIGKATFGTLCL